jgi:hypothetical protein
MTVIRDLLARDLDRKIEEIIKVDQADENAVYTELTEYVVTDRISDQYRGLLTAIAEAPGEPDEGVGVWISGFFGSGKSSFAKNLGYALKNPTIRGTSAADLFKQQFADERVRDLVTSINRRIPTDVLMFDVQVDRAVRRNTEPITEIMYTVLLRELGYAEDFDIAELEIQLEGEGKLAEFERRCGEMYGRPWMTERKGALTGVWTTNSRPQRLRRGGAEEVRRWRWSGDPLGGAAGHGMAGAGARTLTEPATRRLSARSGDTGWAAQP